MNIEKFNEHLKGDSTMDGKVIWQSKTFWVNVIGIVGIMVHQYVASDVTSAEIEGVLMLAVNIVLRIITKGPIVW